MFSNIKLSRNPSPPALNATSSGSTGPESSKGQPSSHDPSGLTARGSPGATGGAAYLAPRKTLNRLNALPSHAKASAPPALPERHVRFAALAQVKEDGRAPEIRRVDFGPKNKPQRIQLPGAMPGPSHSAAPARPPEPPKLPEQPQSHGAAESSRGKGGLFGRLFSSHGPKADKPTSGPSRPPAPSPVSAGPGPRAKSPAQKFNDRLWDFMHNYPGTELKQKITNHLVAGTFEQLKRDLAAAAASPGLDQENFGRLQLTLSSLHQMNGNYEDVRVLGVKPPR